MYVGPFVGNTDSWVAYWLTYVIRLIAMYVILQRFYMQLMVTFSSSSQPRHCMNLLFTEPFFGQHYVIRILTPQLRWVKAGFYYCSDYLPQKVYGVFWIVVDDVNKQIGFHGNAPPSHKQWPLIKAALTLFQPMWCRIFLMTSQSWYCSNALHTQNLELTGN